MNATPDPHALPGVDVLAGLDASINQALAPARRRSATLPSFEEDSRLIDWAGPVKRKPPISARDVTRLQFDRIAEQNAKRMRRCDAAINLLFAFLGGIGAAVLLVHLAAREGLL